MKSVEIQIADRLPRHPDFDRYWDSHGGYVYYLANLMAKSLNRRAEELYPNRGRPFRGADFVGVLTTRLNYCLHRWNPDKGALTTYLHKRFRAFAFTHFLRYESEYWAAQHWNERNGHDVKVESAESREFHESEYFLYRVPDEFDSTWAQDVVDLFESPIHLWEFLAKGVPERSVNVMLWYYRDGRTYESIGESLGISKERVRQILEATKVNFRFKIVKLDSFRRLFAGGDGPE